MAKRSLLAERIRAQREELMTNWESNVRSLASAALKPQEIVRNGVAQLLDWLAQRLEQPNMDDEQRDEFSRHHTLERFAHGFDLVEVVSEIALLRQCLLEFWEASPEDISPREIRIINEELDNVFAMCAIHYVTQAAGPEALSSDGSAAPPN